jgi:hypothetical protein
MRGGARGATHYHVTTLAATTSRPNPETLATREVLTHLRMAFYPCTCGLHGDAAMVAALIGYGDMELLSGRP